MLKRSLALVVVVGIAALVAASDGRTVSRVFTLEHVSVSEASEAVQPMLSDVGSLTLQPKLARIVVQDEPAIIARVTALIENLDHLPGSYGVRIDLLEGGETAAYGSITEVNVEDRLRRMYKVDSFHRIGSSTVEGVLGSSAQAELGPSFRVSFLARVPSHTAETPWGAPDPGLRLYLRHLVLERVEFASDGTLKTDEILRTNVLLSPNQTVYIGAGKSEESKEVLVLIVHAEDFGGH
jgi:hypothetical protein